MDSRLRWQVGGSVDGQGEDGFPTFALGHWRELFYSSGPAGSGQRTRGADCKNRSGVENKTKNPREAREKGTKIVWGIYDSALFGAGQTA